MLVKILYLAFMACAFFGCINKKSPIFNSNNGLNFNPYMINLFFGNFINCEEKSIGDIGITEIDEIAFNKNFGYSKRDSLDENSMPILINLGLEIINFKEIEVNKYKIKIKYSNNSNIEYYELVIKVELGLYVFDNVKYPQKKIKLLSKVKL